MVIFLSFILAVTVIGFFWYCTNNANYNSKGPEDIERERAAAEKAAADARARKERELQAEIERNTQIITHKCNAVYQNIDIASAIQCYYSSTIQSFYRSMLFRVDLDNLINNHFSSAQKELAELKESVRQLELLTKSYEEKNRSFIQEVEETLLPSARQLAEKFRSYDDDVCRLPESVMMEFGNYGRQNKAFGESILAMTREDSKMFIQHCDSALSKGHLDKIFEIDIEKVLRHVWFFATEKNFSASDFERAKSVFNSIYKAEHADIVLADYYAKKKMGGEEALRDSVRELLKRGHTAKFLTTIASGLMWMNAYQQEHVVLQHMLASGMEMIPKAQERLRALASSGGKAPESFSVESSDDSLYFDVSSLAWRDAEYTGFFDNLAFQDKALTYSLAIRDEDKELSIAQGITVPSTDTLLAKLKEYLAEEFGAAVTARAVRGVALSGNGEEEMDGIVAVSEECRQLGVFITVTRIGRKLSIKFYTLFVPHERDLHTQEQQAVSMSKKLSPKVNVWENGLKDSMLMAVQQLLNSDAPIGPISPVSPVSEPIFF